ncbi:MAG: helix-turn-helix transcriptional regulator, partial [Clostridiaceae bacterium]|nr:helix-turn-helix transcriptional regulator [Clostridiaceae bacterium]
MDNIKVGQLILQLRKEKGLTQQQLADRLNISNKAI